MLCSLHGIGGSLDCSASCTINTVSAFAAQVVVENYADGGYHVPVAHLDLAACLDMKSYSTTVGDRYSVQRVSSKVVPQSTDARDSPVATRTSNEVIMERLGNAAEALYFHLHPSLLLNRYGPWLDVNYVHPTSPTTTSIVYDYFVEQQLLKDPTFITTSLTASDRVQTEDTYLCESVQGGLGSAAYRRGRYAAPEGALHAFHVWIAKDLAGGNP